jgi:UDP-GlcNAc:undecaprenyl-phosphate GlcNAc-1-phosphate transferase
MIITQLQYFLLFVTSYALVGGLTPVMRKIALSKEILDRPNSAHKSHSQPIPYLGGVAIILGVVIITYGSLIIYDLSFKNFWLATSILGPAVAMGLIGLWDDVKQLPPLPRFIGQTIAGVVVAMLLISSDNLGNPTGSTPLDVSISIVWVVGICNAINFFDNLDGGAAGTSVITAIALFFIAVNGGQILIASLSIVLAGATLGFLIWNRSPARIYMGDAGALFLGVLLATLTIRLNPDTNSIIASFSIPVLLLAVPILDTSVAVISRLRRKTSPFQGGKDHLSHRLIRAGVSRKLTVIILWLFSIIFSLFAIWVLSFDSSYELLWILIASLLWVALFIRFITTPDE